MKQDLHIRSPRRRNLVCPGSTRDSLSNASAWGISVAARTAIPAKQTS